MCLSRWTLRHIELKVCHCIFLGLLHGIVFSLQIKKPGLARTSFQFFHKSFFFSLDRQALDKFPSLQWGQIAEAKWSELSVPERPFAA